MESFGWRPYILTSVPECATDYYLKDEELIQKIPQNIALFRAPAFHPLEYLLKIRNRFKRNGSSVLSAVSAMPVTVPIAGGRFGRWVKGKIEFLMELTRIPDRQVGWLPFAFIGGLIFCAKTGCKVVYSSGSPWTAHLVGLLISGVLRRPLVVDFRDPWIQNPYRIKKHQFIENIEIKLESFIVKSAKFVIANTNRARSNFIDNYKNENPAKFIWISNGYSQEDFEDQEFECSHNSDQRLKISHVGTIYGPRSPLKLFSAISRLKRQGRIDADNFNLRLVGKYDPRLCVVAESNEYDITDLVTFVAQVSHEKALSEIVSSDVQLIIQPGTALQVPGKLFECIGANKVVLALTNDGATSDIVLGENFGIVLDPESEDEISNCLIGLVDMKKKHGEIVFSNNSNRNKFESLRLTNHLINVFEECLRR